MRESVGIPAGLLVYFLSTTILLLIVQAAFTRPQDWPTLITIAVSIIAFKLTCAAVKNFSTETGVAIVAFMITAFWLLSLGFDVFAGFDALMTFLSADPNSPKVFESFKELANSVMNKKICAGVSLIMAVGTLGK